MRVHRRSCSHVASARSIGGKNTTGINFALIANQVIFIDTIKYFQQSLATFASTMADKERLAVKTECKKFILKDKDLAKKKQTLLRKISGVGLMITRFDSLNIAPGKDNFFHQFYSSLKDTIMTEEEYNNIKKFYQILKLKNLEELTTFRTPLFCVRCSNKDLIIYKSYLDLTQENVIARVHLVAAYTETKVNV